VNRLSQKYPRNVWLTTIIGTPLADVIFFSFKASGLPDAAMLFMLFILQIVLGGVLSLPAYFLFRLLFGELQRSALAGWMQRLLLGSTGVVLVCVSFFFLDRRTFSETDPAVLMWPISYSVVLLISTFLLHRRWYRSKSLKKLKTVSG